MAVITTPEEGSPVLSGMPIAELRSILNDAAGFAEAMAEPELSARLYDAMIEFTLNEEELTDAR